jgi:hypothetical protein
MKSFYRYWHGAAPASPSLRSDGRVAVLQVLLTPQPARPDPVGMCFSHNAGPRLSEDSFRQADQIGLGDGMLSFAS